MVESVKQITRIHQKKLSSVSAIKVHQNKKSIAKQQAKRQAVFFFMSASPPFNPSVIGGINYDLTKGGVGDDWKIELNEYIMPTIRVWYIYLHLVDVYGKYIGKYAIHGCYEGNTY